MKIEEIKNGIVIDHITAGKGEELYASRRPSGLRKTR